MTNIITLPQLVLNEVRGACRYGNSLAREVLLLAKPETDYTLNLHCLDCEAREWLINLLNDLGEL